MASLLMRLIMIWMALFPILTPLTTSPIQNTSYHPRLEKLTSWGSAPTALTGDQNQLFMGQDSVLTQAHLDENQQLVTDYEVDLGYGRILALQDTPSTLYILTVSTLVVFDVQNQAVVQTIRENGTAISTQNDWLVVTQPNTRRLYQIQANGQLIYRQTITSATQLQAFAVLPDNLFIQAEAQYGLSWQRRAEDGHLSEQSHLAALQNINQLATQANWTYTTRGSMLDVINTTNPNQPRVAGVYNPLHQVQDMVWQNGYLVFADGDGLKLHEANNLRQAPRYLNGERGTPALQVVAADQAIIVSRPDAIEFYDANLWPNLEPTARFPIWDEPTALLHLPNSNRVLVGLGASGIAVFDFTNLFNPQLLGIMRFSASVTDLAANPHDINTIHVLLNEGRLTTLQLNWNDLSTSRILSDLPLAGYPTQMVLDANHNILAVASSHAAIYFFSLTQTQPELLFSYAAETKMTQVAVNRHGEWYIVDDRKLLLIELLPEQQSVHILDETLLGSGENGRLIDTPQGILWGQGHHLQLLNPRTHHIEFLMNYESPTGYTAMLATPERVFLATENPDLGVIVVNTTNPRRPFEQVIISLPFVVDNWIYSSQGLLVSNAQAGIMQWQTDWSASRVNPSQLTWVYQVPHRLTSLTEQPYRGALNNQGDYVYQTDQGLNYLQLPVHHQLQVVADAWLGIDEDYHLSRLAFDGEVIATNQDLLVKQFAQSETGLIWAITTQNELVAVDAVSLAMTTPAIKMNLDVDVTALTVSNDYLLIGTMDGELLRLNMPDASTASATMANLITAQLTDLGGPIAHIESYHSDLLVTAGADSVWWLSANQPERFSVQSRYQSVGGSVNTISLAPSNEWLAVSLGSCGLAVLDARQPEISLPLYAQWSAGVITDVSFISDNEILAVLDGVPTVYRFNPDGDKFRLSVPALPYPPDKIPVGAPVTELKWHVPAADCQNLTYEVWLNGERLAETTQPKLELAQPLYFDADWYIVVKTQADQSISSPIWQIYAQSQGWHQRPLRFQARLRTDEDSTGRSWPWFIFGGLGLMVLGLIIWFVAQRYIHTRNDEETYL